MQYQLSQAKLQVVLQRQLMAHRLQQLERSIQEEGGVSLMHYQTKRHLQEQLLRLTQAQDRIHSGTYGICMACSEMIEPERMEIVPDTTMCAACIQKALRTHTRSTARYNRSVNK